MQSQAQLSRQQSLPSASPSLQKTWCLGTSQRLYGTALHGGVNYKHQWQRAYRRRPTPLETQEKRQRQKHAHHRKQFTHAQFHGGRFPAKFGCQPIKFELYLLVHAYPGNCVRVHFKRLGVY